MSIVAFEAAYRHGEPWLDELLAYMEGTIDMVEEFLAKEIPSISLVRPEGTYVPLVDFRSLGMDPDQLHNFLIKAGVAMNRGGKLRPGRRGLRQTQYSDPPGPTCWRDSTKLPQP